VKWDGHTWPTCFVSGIQLKFIDLLSVKKDIGLLAIVDVKSDSLKFFDGIIESMDFDLRPFITLNLRGLD
jgi:hypothetical protein